MKLDAATRGHGNNLGHPPSAWPVRMLGCSMLDTEFEGCTLNACFLLPSPLSLLPLSSHTQGTTPAAAAARAPVVNGQEQDRAKQAKKKPRHM